jgi:hypothetical protein
MNMSAMTEQASVKTKQASSATTSLIYLTVGSLMIVWTAISYFWLIQHEGHEASYYWCYGFFFSGLVLVLIGLAVGRIGRAARHAEVTARPALVAPPVAVPQAAIPVDANGFASSQGPVVAKNQR